MMCTVPSFAIIVTTRVVCSVFGFNRSRNGCCFTRSSMMDPVRRWHWEPQRHVILFEYEFVVEQREIGRGKERALLIHVQHAGQILLLLLKGHIRTVQLV